MFVNKTTKYKGYISSYGDPYYYDTSNGRLYVTRGWVETSNENDLVEYSSLWNPYKVDYVDEYELKFTINEEFPIVLTRSSKIDFGSYSKTYAITKGDKKYILTRNGKYY